ncbi:DUF2800 domain-containing protein [Lactococcus lactis]|uniref:Phage protein n=1 Tax=Lactococcus lactis TaxID=1358 RepID=A0AAW5TT83_9LACT|nr:DUF2800 domain-containing protein [Lactococcus lactis]MCW2281472.1 hypothetical protein [Lactococcus lactis]
MDLQLIPLDGETGETLLLNPSMIKDWNNSELQNACSQLKALEKIKKEVEKEIKRRLDEGQQFTRLSYGKQQYTRVISAPPEVKAALIKKYGYDSVEPLAITKLEKKFGEEIYKDLQPYIVEKPKSPAIKWDA